MRQFTTVLIAALLAAACGGEPPEPPPTPTPEALTEHGEEFREDVVEVTEGVYVAIGFGIANSILIEGEDAAIVVDVMESLEAAERIAERFRAITDKPVKALVYTHSHPDHIHGGAAFVDPDDRDLEIFAHDSLIAAADKISGVLQPIITHRSMRMYGNPLPDEQRTNVGLGAFVAVGEDSTLQVLRPTQTFDHRLEVEVAGVKLVMEHAPGETEDQIFVWLPDKRVLLPADNFYKAFPNLYTIRGTSYRDPKQWADSLDRMRALGAEHLVPSHGRPISGAEEVDQRLTEYRDGIRYVYDQTIRLMNAGATPDEIAERLTLPPHLAESPYLQTFYGKPSWSARAVFQGELGWYDGNPSQLQPTAPGERAQRMAALAGGEGALLEALEQAAADSEHQWLLELSDHFLRLRPDHERARKLRIDALRALAASEHNPGARHYYLTTAAELEGTVTVPERVLTPRDEMLRAMPLSIFFDGMAVALDGPAAWEVEQSVAFEFPDLDTARTLTVRRGVSELAEGVSADADIHVRVDSLVFKRMLAGLRNPALAIATDFDYVEGGRLGFAGFMRLFNPEIELEE
ncbi:alkyl sulfatase dimerization domain-containing protein [Algiphilus aromaticivorans]|uniref:alkyl sulfatase dimerization domain-containing protein n=1 Tax=Algiphilus aromaticivorans TaxID=382454 RepID=UPI0006936FB0|nr:alkyl sulfatase dimerization domain-containing protein [Algiphilus aromaticivorans]